MLKKSHYQKYPKYLFCIGLICFVPLLNGCLSNYGEDRTLSPPVVFESPLRQDTQPVPANGIVIVAGGDNLYDIASRYEVTPQSIIRENNLLPPYNVNVGQSLKIIPPRVHVVRYGDSVNLISQMYAVSSFQLAQLNELRAPFELRVGQNLQLPTSLDFSVLDGNINPTLSQNTVARLPAKKSVNRKKFVAPSFGHSGFTWPVKGEVIVEFGPAARGVYNDGVNILAESGRPVTVSANGTVAFVGNNIKNFGKLVLVKHDGGYMTAYAHLGEILVSEGDVLTTGDTIGSIGSTGRVDTPQLHFEIRKSRKPIDPRSLIS